MNSEICAGPNKENIVAAGSGERLRQRKQVESWSGGKFN